MSTLKDKIFAAKDIETETVEVPEWGVTLEVRGLDGRGRSRVIKNATNADDGEIDLETLYPTLIIATTFDPETGEKVFDEEDAAGLMSKSGAIVDRLATASMRLSGLTQAAVDEAKKDSSSTPSDDTSSN